MMRDIRKFSKSTGIFILILIIPYLVYGGISMYTSDYKSKITPGVYSSINKCRNSEIKADKIIITDSAGAQLYKEDDSTTADDFFVINSTRAMGYVGHYLLLNELARNQKGQMKDKQVYFLFIPSVFMDNLNQKFTFNYFVKPFYNDDFMPYLEDKVINHIEENIPMYWTSQLPLIKTTNWSVDYSNAQEFHRIEQYFISELSLVYLKKSKKLAEQYGFDLKIKSPFMREDKRQVDRSRMTNQIKEHELEDIFRNYFEEMKYIPDSVFVDRDHFDESEYIVGKNPLNL